tara:strand:+ start:1996 stop:2577 length:582 start_codon:yes stop_codon:yes gene_type:complete
MTLTELLKDKNKLQKIEKKTKKIIKENEKITERLTVLYSFISTLTVLIIFGIPSLLALIPLCLLNMAFFFSIILCHKKIRSTKYPKSYKYRRLFKFFNAKTEKLVKKNKHFIKNVDIEKNNNYYFDNIIKSIKNSSLEEVQFNEIKLKEYIEECNKKEQEEIKNIIKLKEIKLNNKIEDLSELKKLNNLIKGI